MAVLAHPPCLAVVGLDLSERPGVVDQWPPHFSFYRVLLKHVPAGGNTVWLGVSHLSELQLVVVGVQGSGGL